MIHNEGGIQRVIALIETDLTYIAVGTGTTPTVNATQLTTELYRKAISSTLIDGNVLIEEVFFDENEANGTLTELGILGTGATGAAGTGRLFASEGANISKDSTQSLTVSVEIEIKEVTT